MENPFDTIYKLIIEIQNKHNIQCEFVMCGDCKFKVTTSSYINVPEYFYSLVDVIDFLQPYADMSYVDFLLKNEDVLYYKYRIAEDNRDKYQHEINKLQKYVDEIENTKKLVDKLKKL